MKCPYCGKEVPTGTKVCPRCFAEIEAKKKNDKEKK